ncbi:MAG: hypothetical protein GF334_07375 [Candidatus Altiarchaeales archaeon]|nr:hypothetical protein [Candidatus Altiarchaeales archaeon]
MELYYHKQENYWVIKEGEAALKLTDQQFIDMKKDGRSPLLLKLYMEAKKQRQSA